MNLYGSQIFFNDWTPYDERQDYLLEADVGVSLHFAHVETHFSFRTRLLDHLWAALPTIVTRGDVLSDLIEKEGLGWVVDYESVDEVTAAILESAGSSRRDRQDRFAAVIPQFSWHAVMQPLVAFCREPRCAPDRERTRSDLQALPALKLMSHIQALRRDVAAKDERLVHLDNVLHDRETRIAALETQVRNWTQEARQLRETMEQIQQGRVMRLLNALDRITGRARSRQP